MDTEIDETEIEIEIEMSSNVRGDELSNSKKRAIRSSKTIELECILDPHGRPVLIWNGIFLLSSIVALTTDPFFLYIPIIKDHKCLGVDKKIMFVTLILRSITDFICLIHLLFTILEVQKHTSADKDMIKEESQKTINTYRMPNIRKDPKSLTIIMVIDITIDILALLPIPQVIVLCFISKMTSSKYSWDKANARIFLNIILFLQYAPRSFRILILYNKLKWHVANRAFTAWVKSILNLFLYLTASHVGGAFYHVLAMEQETTCWYHACQKQAGCVLSTFECDYESNVTTTNASVNGFCDPNSTVFDFGVFSDAINSSILGSTDIPVKFVQFLSWGLRNLSTFGQNLEPSTGTILETGFVACVGIFGLILFIYLIGNVQTFMQLEGTKSEDIRRTMKLKDREVGLWVRKHFLPEETKTMIMQKIHSDLKKLKKDLEVENVVNTLPKEDKKSIKSQLSYSTLKKVPLLRHLNEKVLEDFIDHMELVNYDENTYIVREGESLDLMIFITQGIVWTFEFNNIDENGVRSNTIIKTKSLVKGDFYGEEILDWTIRRFTANLGVPISNTNVKTHTKVEVLLLMYEDLKMIVEKHWSIVFSKLRPQPPKFKLKQVAATLIQRAWQRRRNTLLVI